MSRMTRSHTDGSEAAEVPVAASPGVEDGSETSDAGTSGLAAAGAEDGAAGRRRLVPAVRWPSTTKARFVALAVVVGLVAAGVGGYFWLKDRLPEGAAFRIGERVVSIEEMNDAVDTWRAMYGVEVPREEDKLDPFRRDTAKAYAVSLLLDAAAEERGIRVGEKAARDALARLISRQAGDGPEARDAFVQALSNYGTSERAVLEEVKKQLLMAQLFTTVTGDVPTKVSGQDVADAFAARKEQLGTPERRQLANIVVRTEADARKLIEDVRSGASFETLARRRSMDEATRDKGGDLGAVTRDQLENAYAKAAFAAEPGVVFGPVRSQFGWNVGMVIRIERPVPASLEDVENQLRKQLEFERAVRHWQGWLAGRLRDADIDYADEYRPADPHAPPGDVAPDGGPVGTPQGPPR